MLFSVYNAGFSLFFKEIIMKADIHPVYQAVQVECSCGNQFETGSTLAQKKLKIEVCAKCHPFYTGSQKITDTGGRVGKFNARFKNFGKTASTAS